MHAPPLVEWTPYEAGASLGWAGSQGGTIARDEELAGQLRLTYELDDSRAFHAVTCAVSGWLLHHRFFDNAEAASEAYDAMKPALEELRTRLREGGPGSPEEARRGGPLLAAFLARFP
ncbi:hypothetical protein SAMN05443572_103486 [Myxococcus fulvus]|uniref:Uncharacterized protein n=1 Tax=Myxococcus fulvus TaxID=33 RepID=A0A511TEI6_MYXFU|nr:hypothetical protein [Myxococcus fulvus]GEN12580.1 hypothetical protein MFU01_76170 [Myxococcus fulvus]SET84806.1 hypothetical protein SAMN05443572_103486 [Myxococcus fulvus]